MVGIAQLVEPRIVIPVVVGSSPIIHPIYLKSLREIVSFFFWVFTKLLQMYCQDALSYLCYTEVRICII